MLALLRLAVSAFFFGLLSCLLYFLIRLLARALLPLGGEFPPALAARLHPLFAVRERGDGRGARFFLFFRDCGLSILAFLFLILFLFWQADGTVRAFVLLAVFLGGLLSVRLYRRHLVPWEHRVIFFTKYLLLFITRPLLALLLRCGSFFLAFLRKIASFIIKILKRYDTAIVASFYRRCAVRRLLGRRMRRRLLAALEERGALL